MPLASIADDIAELQYLYIVDGIWSYDSNNPAAGYDFAGKRYSTFALPRTDRPQISPRIAADKTTFTFDPHNRDITRISQIDGSTYFVDTERQHTVFIAGSFNGWNPFAQPLERVEENGQPYYRVSLTVPRGEHRYYFVIDGVPILDPLNDDIAVEPNGRRTSLFRVQ